MATKHWVADALSVLAESLAPVPHESNELDWKATLSANKDRLAEHLMAMANLSQGGCLVFGINDDGKPVGIDADAVERIVGTLANLGREAIEPPIALDHSVNLHQGVPVLLVRIPAQAITPVHRRGKSVEETWIRSAGTTRKASRQEVGALMMNSAPAHWEDLRASSILKLADVKELLDLRAIAQLLERPLSEDDEVLARWLVDEGLTTLDGRGHCITHFGAIAAARYLKDFPNLARKAIRVIHYQGANKVDTVDELLGQRGYLSSQTLTNTTLRERFKLHDKQRNAVTNLIADAVEAGRIKRKDGSTGNKFAEYVPYWA